VGESRNPSDPASNGLDPKNATLRIKFRIQNINNPAAVAAKSKSKEDERNRNDQEASDGEDAGVGWDAVLWKGRLYVSVTPKQLSGGSKEAFVSLLEYAEEILEVSHVIVCLGKPNHVMGCNLNTNLNIATNNNDDKDTKMAIRNFLFLGFQPLAPGHEFMPSNPNLVCFVYSI